MVVDQHYDDLENFRGIELEIEIERLGKELDKKDAKVTSLYNEKTELYRRWTNGETFVYWQAEQKRLQEIEKIATQMRKDVDCSFLRDSGL